MQVNLLARQPIYNKDNQLFAFELLYRNSSENVADIDDDFKATSELIANFCTGNLDEELCANSPVFINVDLEFITSDCFFSSPPLNVVFEILETVEITKESINTIKILSRKGFRFALDDFDLKGQHSKLFPYIAYLKLDVQAQSLDDVETFITHLDDFGFTLLAEKVEDKQCFDRCVSMGIEFFQGYYLQRPELITGKKVSSNKQVALQLITELNREDISNTEITAVIAADPRMTFKLLKIVNCPLYPFKREIENIHEAVIMLGIDVIKQWAQILTLTSECVQPLELFRTLLVRAKTCELYAKKLKLGNGQDYFTIGLFSGLDAVLNMSLAAVLNEVQLSPHIKEALQKREKRMSNILFVVRSYERKPIAVIRALPDDKGTALADCYWQGVKWADKLMLLFKN